MSFVLDLPAAPASLVRRIRGAMCAFAGGAGALALVMADGHDRWWIGIITVLLFLVALRPAAGGLTGGRLSIDEGGRAFWHPPGIRQCDARAVHIERWSLCGPFAWLALRFPATHRARHLLLLRGIHDDENWRRLRAWLVWRGRGTPSSATTGSMAGDDTA